ncbi:hypothetical protein QZH41_006249 [Actinostola sp. cb2023]|nr:hypothetical protein QZH41_006249 [Actinostola sp. cb2023]
MDIFAESDYGSSFGRELNRIRQERRFCDVTLIVEGKQFHAHQIILAARSKYFYGVFTNDMLEKRSQTVSLGELSASAMESLLEYLYTGDVEVNEPNAEDLVIAANYLLLPRLKLLAGKFLEREMIASNCVYYFKFAEQYNCKELKHYCSQMIRTNFGTIGHTKDFMHLGVRHLEELISGDDVVVRSEEEIFEAILKWIYDDPEGREDYFSLLFRHVRVTSMSQSYLFCSLATNTLVKNNPDCLARILEASKMLLIGDGLLLEKPRKCLETHVDAIITCGGLSPDTLVRDTTYCYIPSDSTWYELAPMKVKRCRHGFTACCGFLYAIGGKDEGFHKTVERYDPKTNSWTTVAPLKRCVKLIGTTTLNATLYVVGGIEFTAEEGRRRCAAVQKYDPATNMWSLVASISSRRSSVCCVSDEHHLYSIGGLGDDGFLDSLERYDPKLNTWMHLAPMAEKRGCACGVLLRGKIYIFGGTVDAFSRQSKRSCEFYDIHIDQWHSMPPMHIPRFHAGAVLLRDCVYVLGGIGTDSLNSDGNKVVECYNIKMNKWMKEHTIPYEETYLRSVSVSLYKGLIESLPKLGSRANIS